VAIRTYRSLSIYRTDALLVGGPADFTLDTRPLKQRVGESIALDDRGDLWLGSEASGSRAPQLARIACPLTRP